jgi:hypothetical protein
MRYKVEMHFSLALFVLFTFHPVHISFTSIDQPEGTDSMNVFIRIYYDDFLLDCNHCGTETERQYFLKNSETVPSDKLNKYITEKVNIIVNNKELNGKLLSRSLIDNELNLNLFYSSVNRPDKIIVRNNILTGIYADQANMTIIRIGDFEEGVKLTPENNEQTFNLKKRSRILK